MALTRRSLLQALAPAGLLWELSRRSALAAPARGEARRFLAAVDEASRALQARELAPRRWQERVEELGRALDLDDLRRAVDFDRLARALALPREGSAEAPVRLPARLRFATKIFGLGRGCAITPHGHRNMVSMHTVLRGQLRIRHFDRVRDERPAQALARGGLAEPGGHLVLRPTIDRVAGPGDATSISSERDNVHWLLSQSDAAFTFDCILGSLDPRAGYPFAIDLVDPDRAERLPGGELRAPVIGWTDSISRYGHS